jgi:bacterial/archaeal transporter family-2 protein
MQSRLLFIALALVLGAILPIQAAVNSRLAKTMGSSEIAAFISFAVGTVVLFIYLLLSKQLNWQGAPIRQSPWWIWIGGVLGTFFVAGIVIVVPRLGSVLAFTLVLAGQMLLAIIIDQFGWLGMSVREISMGRIAGVILLIAGVIMIRKF